ncbi:MAG: class I SAM-dependent methyltransferase [Firmicutes bacterium]|nr:class I SAM-dependent methyltransferase [Bacillota bacterium]
MGEVKEYFKEKAKEYDDVDHQLYWVLSDMLLWNIFDEQVLSNYSDKEFTFLDAGAGTGRWTLKILEKYPKAKGIMIDLSSDMIDVAKEKLNSRGYSDRVEIIIDNLDTVKVDESVVDISFTFHNVLGFVENPQIVIGKMNKTTKLNGYVVCGVPNFYHNIYFNIASNNLDLASETFNNHMGRFTKEMPQMHMFTPVILKKIYSDIKIKNINVHGFPVCIYPGYSETQLHGQTKSLKNALEDTDYFNKIYEMEKKLIMNEECACRGNQIVIIGKKS